MTDDSADVFGLTGRRVLVTGGGAGIGGGRRCSRRSWVQRLLRRDHGVRVNAVAPDVTQTPQVDYRRLVPPEDEHLWSTWGPLGLFGTAAETADVSSFSPRTWRTRWNSHM